MPDTPERVLTPEEFNRLLGYYRSGRGGKYDAAADTLSAQYVTLLDRALDAERERDAAESEMATWRTIAKGNGDRARMGDEMLAEERASAAAMKSECDLAAKRLDLLIGAGSDLFDKYEAASEESAVLRARVAALEAEREALMPLARFAWATFRAARKGRGMPDAELVALAVDYGITDKHGVSTPATIAARALLSKEAP